MILNVSDFSIDNIKIYNIKIEKMEYKFLMKSESSSLFTQMTRKIQFTYFTLYTGNVNY